MKLGYTGAKTSIKISQEVNLIGNSDTCCNYYALKISSAREQLHKQQNPEEDFIYQVRFVSHCSVRK